MTLKEWLKEWKRLHDSEYRRGHRYEFLDKEENRLSELYKKVIPEVGDMGTQILYSDTYAFTITEVVTPNKVKIRLNDYKIADYYDGEGEILPSFWGEERTITRRKNGIWYELGRPSKRGEVIYSLAYVRTYRDPSF